MSYTPPPFEEADRMTREIVAFLQSCGGVYDFEAGPVPLRLYEAVLMSLATGQYILIRDEAGEIVHYVAYWKIFPEDVPAVEAGGRPSTYTHGSVLYMAEHGNKAGAGSLAAVRRELRQRAAGMQGCFWNSKGRGIRKFMKQKGA